MQYNEFMQEIEKIANRKQEAAEEVKVQSNLMAGLEQDFDKAILDDDKKRVDEVVSLLEEANIKKEALEKRHAALNKTNVQSIIKNSSKLKELADKVIIENGEALVVKQQEFNKELQELEKLREAFLQKVQQLGQIYREGNKLGSQLSEVKRNMTGEVTAHSIQFDWSDITKKGAIYIPIADSERTFKGVDNSYKVR